MTSELEKRLAEDAEYERRQRQKVAQLALEMVATHYGQADWQRFRAREPHTFFRAKIEILEGPPEFRLEVSQSWDQQPGDLTFRFDWFVGEWRRYKMIVPARELQRQESESACAADEFLDRVCMRHAAHLIERDSGALVRFRIRGNRAAYEHAMRAVEARRSGDEP